MKYLVGICLLTGTLFANQAIKVDQKNIEVNNTQEVKVEVTKISFEEQQKQLKLEKKKKEKEKLIEEVRKLRKLMASEQVANKS